MENDVYRARPEKKRRFRKLKFIFPALAIFGLYAFRQAYLINANGVDTVKALEGHINDSIVSQGIICRDEVVLTHSASGVVDYLVEDGERVSKGRLIANVYPTYSDVRNLNLLRNKQNMTEDIDSVSAFLDYGTIDMSVTKKQLSLRLSDLSRLSSTNAFEQINNKLEDLTLNLNKIGVATGRITDFSQARAQLTDDISTIKADINRSTDNLYTSYTGYFIKTVDGYENIASVDNFLNMTVEEGMNVINGSAPQNTPLDSYGKIVTDYKWSVCTYIDKEQGEKLSVGKNVRLSVDVKNNDFVKATVKNIVDMGEKYLVVIESPDMSSQVVKQRIVDCEILFKQYNGIKIPKTAIHFDGEQMGVFVNFSNLVKFKKITPIFEDENYIVVPVENSAENQVKLHDAIIVKGRNLYDGKYL